MYKKLILIILILLTPILSEAADRYWVGGTGNWSDDTNHWATTSGGLPGAGNLPGTGDNANFDTLSHTTNFTVTINASAQCANLNMAAPLTNKVTWAGSSAMDIYGNINLSGGTAGITRTYTGTITMKATSGTKTIDPNGVTLNSTFTMDGVGGTFQLSNDLNISNKVLTLTNGTFDSNGKAVTASRFSSSNSNTRTITLGASTFTLNDTTTCWTTSQSVGLTLNANTSTINCTGAGGDLLGGAKTYNTVNFTGGGFVNINQANTFANLTYTGATAQDDLRFAANNTITTLLTITGTSQGKPVFVGSQTFNTKRTLTAASVSLTNVNFQDITAAGAAAPFSGTSIGDATNNTSITFDGAVTRYWVGNGGSWSNTARWSTSSGGSSGATVPLPQDTVIFDSNSISSGSQTITVDGTVMGLSVDFSAVTNNPTLAMPGAISTTYTSIYGNLTLKSGMTMTNNSNLYFFNRGSTATFTTGGVSITAFPNINAISGTVLLGDNTTCTVSGFQVNNGTFDANNKDLTQVSYNQDNGNTRTVNMGSGTWTMTGTGQAWSSQTVTNLTFNRGTSTIKYTDASASSKSFSGGGLTYYNFWFTGAGTGTMTIIGSNTFKDFKIDTQPKTILFTAGTTQTIQSLTATGTSGNLITLNSSSNGSAWTLRSSSAYITGDYLSLRDSTATGGATFYAGSHSTNTSGNTNWQFADPPALIKISRGGSID